MKARTGRFVRRSMLRLPVRAVALAAVFFGGLLLSESPAVADTVNDQPWIAGNPIPPDVAGGAASGYTEGACDSRIGDNIYIAFGFDRDSGDSRGLRVYNVPSGLWSTSTTKPTESKAEFYNGVAKGGKLFCIGGRSTNSVWRYDPPHNAWTTVSPIPGPLRVGAAIVTFGPYIYVFGGRPGLVPCSSTSPTTVYNDIWRYDVNKDAWTSAGTLNYARADLTAARVGSKIYVFGGCNGKSPLPESQFVEVYSPKTQSSTPLPGACIPPVCTRREDAMAADPQNGSSANASHRIHLAGGWNPDCGQAVGCVNSNAGQHNHIIFDVDQQTFVAGMEMPRRCDTNSNLPTADRAEIDLVYGGDTIFAFGGSCPAYGTSLNNLDYQKLSGDPPANKGSLTAYTCGPNTFPICPLEPPGVGVVFVTATGFAPLTTVNLVSTGIGGLPAAVTDLQGEFDTTYVDTACNGVTPETISGTDSTGATVSVTFTCSTN